MKDAHERMQQDYDRMVELSEKHSSVLSAANQEKDSTRAENAKYAERISKMTLRMGQMSR